MALIGHQLALSDANWLTASDGKEPVGAIEAPRQRPLTGKFPGDIDRPELAGSGLSQARAPQAHLEHGEVGHSPDTGRPCERRRRAGTCIDIVIPRPSGFNDHRRAEQ